MSCWFEYLKDPLRFNLIIVATRTYQQSPYLFTLRTASSNADNRPRIRKKRRIVAPDGEEWFQAAGRGLYMDDSASCKFCYSQRARQPTQWRFPFKEMHCFRVC